SDNTGRPRLPLLRWAERRPRDTIGRRPGMRKYVMAITAQRPQIWNDQGQGDPDASPSARRPSGIRRMTRVYPRFGGVFLFSQVSGVPAPQLTSYGQRIISIEPLVPGERFELPTNGLHPRGREPPGGGASWRKEHFCPTYLIQWGQMIIASSSITAIPITNTATAPGS